MESWKNITLNLRGENVEIDGVGFSSIGRLDLLTILQQRLRSVGVTPRYDTLIPSVGQLTGYDLIVGADGLNSMVRRSFEGDFGSSLSYSPNQFAWYGTTKRFETAACDRGCDGACQGLGCGRRYCHSARPLPGGAQADREKAGHRGAHQRRLVREIRRAYEA